MAVAGNVRQNSFISYSLGAEWHSSSLRPQSGHDRLWHPMPGAQKARSVWLRLWG